MIPPVFTDFTYDNLGVPQNVNIPGQPIDQGLGDRPDIAANDPNGLQLGKHKVMSLRNIAITPPYGHNGVFATLEQIVHFYNTRDTLGVCADNNDPGFGVTCWPAPEVPQNVNVDELGNLNLTRKQEAKIVAFLKTLTDGWGEANGMPPLPRPPLPPAP
jgi:cytochrome c peroxidase